MNSTPERLQRAAESILENEALTADLDDAAGQVLMDWGIDQAQRIVAPTLEMDEAAVEEATYQPMRALRKMLRQVNKWAAMPDFLGLEKILEEAATTYGAGYVAPDAEARTQFIDQITSGVQNPAENIENLRRFIEN